MTDQHRLNAIITVALRGEGVAPDSAQILAEELRDTRAALAELSSAGNAVCLALITVEPTLKKPYPDDPRWSPWSRFVEDRWRQLGRAVTAAWRIVPRTRSSAMEADRG